jgi:hypothetical protein
MENSLFERFTAKIIEMRNDGKFDRYRYKYLPSLVRGTEYDPEHLNYLYPVIDKPRLGFKYQSFHFHVFWHTPETRVWDPVLFKVEIFLQYVSFAKLEVRLCRGADMEHSSVTPWLFDWKTMIDQGKSVEDVLHKFEHVFLEVPPARLANRVMDQVLDEMPPPKLYCLPLTSLNYIYNCINEDDDRATDREARALALAMISHNRLGAESSMKLISQNTDLIHTVHNLEQRKNDQITYLNGFI